MYQVASAADINRMKEWLEEFTYRPNVKLIIGVDYAGETLIVEMMVEDTYNPGKQIRVHHRRPIRPYIRENKEVFTDWLAHELQYVEVHESMEWFKWRNSGRPVFDPHEERP